MLYGLLHSPWGIMVLAIQALCVIHCARTGGARYWYWIILAFSLLGSLAYLFVEVLPYSLTAKRIHQRLDNLLHPGRDLRTHSTNFALSTNVSTTCQYAEQLARKGKFEEAVRIYNDARKGVFQFDPLLLWGLASTCFQAGQYAASVGCLRDLVSHHPDHNQNDVRLLLARALAETGDFAGADRAYKAIAPQFPGPEAKCRYAQFLLTQQREVEAFELFRDIDMHASVSPKHYQRLHKEWIGAARQALKQNRQPVR